MSFPRRRESTNGSKMQVESVDSRLRGNDGVPNPPRVMLSFDLEEFDIPTEYGQAVDLDEQMAVGRRGAEATLAMLERLNVPATFFTTAHFAEAHPQLMRRI